MNIYFYHPIFEKYNEAELMSKAEDFSFFSTGPMVWIVQTYIKLKLAGYPVHEIFSPPKSGIVVLHSHHFYEFWNKCLNTSNIITVCVRADREPNKYADFEVLQNSFFEDMKRAYYIPHWPQPNLIKRDRNRGTQIKRIAFKGFSNNLNAMFSEPDWERFLNVHRIEWVVDAEPWKDVDTKYSEIKWNDYSDIDLIVAIRSDVSCLYNDKPASKLVNSWIAGVPCILGPEQAYRELRLSNLDYIEVTSMSDLKTSVNHLLSNAHIYEMMIENGKHRAKEFTEEAVTILWGDLLFNNIRKLCLTPFKRIKNLLPLGKRNKLW